jgi:5-methylcytosine-specific restriction endonuclease McrA
MKLEQKILQLRSEGKTYSEISRILDCSKGTISYFCGKDQKEKTRNRNLSLKNKNNISYVISKRIDNFYRESIKQKNIIQETNSKLIKRINDKVVCFHRERKTMKYKKTSFTAKDILDSYEKDPTCKLTGRKIDINNTRSWNLDHIIPVSKGGDDSFENCQITCKQANAAKNDLSLDEFLLLCSEVLVHHGYTISKN